MPHPPKRRPKVQTKRVYEPPSRNDGLRVLVDRVWPRGLSKKEASLDHWLKDLAPTTKLRKWFSHDPERWHEFRRRYFEELDRSPDPVEELRRLLEGRRVTLLYAAKNEEYNNAAALKEYLERGL